MPEILPSRSVLPIATSPDVIDDSLLPDRLPREIVPVSGCPARHEAERPIVVVIHRLSAFDFSRVCRLRHAGTGPGRMRHLVQRQRSGGLPVNVTQGFLG